MKTFICKDMGMACDFTAKAETEEELMKQVMEHGQSAHKTEMEEMAKTMSAEDIEKAVKEKIKDEA